MGGSLHYKIIAYRFDRPGSSQSYKDEIEAYTAYKAHGHFTPHPSGKFRFHNKIN